MNYLLELPAESELEDWAHSSDDAVALLKRSVHRILTSLAPDEFGVVEASAVKVAVRRFEVRGLDGTPLPGWNVRAFVDTDFVYEVRCRANGAVGQVVRITKVDPTPIRAQDEMRPLPLSLPGGGVLSYVDGNFKLQSNSTFVDLRLEPIDGDGEGGCQAGSDEGLVLADRSTPEKTYLLLARHWCGVDLWVAELDAEAGVLRVSQDKGIYDYPALLAVRANLERGYEAFLIKDDTLETRVFFDPNVMDANMSGARMADFYPNSGWKRLRWVDDVCRNTFGCVLP